MPDPTPTPDTLRAAIEALCDEWNRWQGEMAPHSITASTLRGCVTDLRAALAASPAPTDSVCGRVLSRVNGRPAVVCMDAPDHRGNHDPAPTDTPDERCAALYGRAIRVNNQAIQLVVGPPPAMPPDHGEWLPDAGTYVDGTTEEQRRTEVRGSDRPAAVTAPREDERAPIIAQSDHPKTRALCGRTHAYDGPDRMCIRPDGHADLAAACVTCGHGRVQHTEDGVCLACESQHAFHQFLAAAAPAVERATPDTLAAILAKADGYPPPATAPAHYDQARALIAAGVTLNETAGQ